MPRAALVVAPRMVARAGFLAELGLAAVEHPSGMGEHIPAGLAGVTAVPGVWVAGNVTDLTAQVGAAAAAGAMAGAHINADLVAEETRDAVLAHRDAFTRDAFTADVFTAEAEARLCEQVAGDRRHGL